MSVCVCVCRFVLGFDAFGDLLQPSGVTGGVTVGPQATAVKPGPSPSNKVLTGDLDSSLASLAMNLTINKSAAPKYGISIRILKKLKSKMTFSGVEPVSGILARRRPTKLAPPFNLNSRPLGSGIRSP